MLLNKLSLKDKNIFNKFLRLNDHNLCVYAFENILIWKTLFSIEWAVIEGSLCIFFRDKMGCFLYLPPLSKGRNKAAVDKVFLIMDKLNLNKEISRIENIEASEVGFYTGLGLEVREKSCDYTCLRTELARLKGNRFKSKRSAFNYFSKNYQAKFLPLKLKDRNRCLGLFDSWMQERKDENKDSFYQGMMKDSRKAFLVALDNYSRLDFSGCIVEVDKEIKGFSFGFRLNKNTFCILYEITDLSIKGLAQFIFAKFCRQLKEYKYINIMDDSGLENLKRVKLSYHPLKIVPAFNALRKNA